MVSVGLTYHEEILKSADIVHQRFDVLSCLCVNAVLDALGLLYTPTQHCNLLICWGLESQAASVRVLDRGEAIHLMCQHTTHKHFVTSCETAFQNWQFMTSQQPKHWQQAWTHTHTHPLVHLQISDKHSIPPHTPHLFGLIPSSPSHTTDLAEGRRTGEGGFIMMQTLL